MLPVHEKVGCSCYPLKDNLYYNSEYNTSNWLGSNKEVLTGGHSAVLLDYILNPGAESGNIGEDGVVLMKDALLLREGIHDFFHYGGGGGFRVPLGFFSVA